MNDQAIVPVDEVSRNAFAARIRVAMGGDSQREFADKIGVSQATVGQYLKANTEPSWSTLLAIAHASGRSILWLMTGSEDGSPAYLPRAEPATHVEINRYAIRASAGNGERIFDEPPASIWQVPREMLRGFSGSYSNLASTDLSGDSMVPTLQDGEPIIFDRSARHVDREGVYVLTIGDDLFVKRLRRVPTKDGTMSLELISDNPAYDRVTLDAEGQEHVRVHGRVIWPDTSRRA